jgi:hypothetical protein
MERLGEVGKNGNGLGVPLQISHINGDLWSVLQVILHAEAALKLLLNIVWLGLDTPSH